MSKHNYSQYSKKNDNRADTNKKHQEKKIEAIEKVSIEEIKPIPEVKMVEETVETVVLPNAVTGVVANCAKLNVRAEPAPNGEVVCVLDAMTEVEIDVANSTDEWFKVCTAIGVEGYCMRKFVNAHL